MALIVLQLLLRQGECGFTHQPRHGNLDPFWPRPLSMRSTTGAVSAALPQGPRDFFTRRALCLAETHLAWISRVAQHGPHRRPIPPRRSRARWNSPLTQQASDGIDAQALLGVGIEYQPHHI